jgi:hypothetical protein
MSEKNEPREMPSSFIDSLEPDYEEDNELDSTVMDIDVKDLNSSSENKESAPKPAIDDTKPVEELLEKEKKLWFKMKKWAGIEK